tara:strand:+ start:2244 stop:2702 length:459 start_codon:yes stop_codon:yes gene_type:complete
MIITSEDMALWERVKGNITVFTNGCFDVMHPGHVEFLCQAKKLGDILIVGLNSDESVKRLKGPSRPILDLKGRFFMLWQLKPVDYVIAFEEDTPELLISRINPNILVKGGDYKIEDIAGADHVRKNDGQVRVLEYNSNYSTTKIINSIRGNP